jgi:hypothetical protein
MNLLICHISLFQFGRRHPTKEAMSLPRELCSAMRVATWTMVVGEDDEDDADVITPQTTWEGEVDEVSYVAYAVTDHDNPSTFKWNFAASEDHGSESPSLFSHLLFFHHILPWPLTRRVLAETVLVRSKAMPIGDGCYDLANLSDKKKLPKLFETNFASNPGTETGDDEPTQPYVEGGSEDGGMSQDTTLGGASPPPPAFSYGTPPAPPPPTLPLTHRMVFRRTP